MRCLLEDLYNYIIHVVCYLMLRSVGPYILNYWFSITMCTNLASPVDQPDRKILRQASGHPVDQPDLAS